VFFQEIPKLPPGVTEIFAHPVLDGRELRAYDTANADIRAHDAVCLTDPAVSDLLARHDVRRISFRELRDLQRACCQAGAALPPNPHALRGELSPAPPSGTA
jgi:hypothetical protein